MSHALQEKRPYPTTPEVNVGQWPHVESFAMHPLDYAQLQQAAAIQGLSITEFLQLAAYLCSRDFLTEQQSQLRCRYYSPATECDDARHSPHNARVSDKAEPST